MFLQVFLAAVEGSVCGRFTCRAAHSRGRRWLSLASSECSPIEEASVCALFGLDGVADTDRAGFEWDELGAEPGLVVPPSVPG